MSAWNLAAAAVLAGLSVGAGTQSAAGGHGNTVYATQAPAVEISAQRKVSVSFSHASAGEVFEWLSKNGADFIAADSEIPKDVSITMSVQDQPIGEVVDALASAMGGHWERRGGIRVFRKGEGFGVWNPQGLAEVRAFGQGGGKVRAFEAPRVRAFGDTKAPFMVPDVKVFTSPEWKENFKDMPEVRIETQKALEEAMKARGESMKDFEKSMADARKELEKAQREHPEAFREGQNWGTFVVPGKGEAFIYRNGKPAPGFGRARTFAPTIGFGSDRDVTRLLESLSPDQKELNRRQGYLRVRDLTSAQRRMIGVKENSKGWMIKISRNGEDLTIKSDD